MLGGHTASSTLYAMGAEQEPRMRQRLLVAGVSTVLSLCGAWVFLAGQEASAEFVGYETLLDFDPEREGGHLLPYKDLLVRSDKPGAGVRWITNSKGFRNEEEFTHEAPGGTYRILFLGDSFVDGHRTDQRKTIGYLMEASLNEQLSGGDYERCEVLVSGHNNPTTAWYGYQEHGCQYQPDLVILGVTLTNDITWNNYGTDMLPVDHGEGVVTLEWSGRYEADSWGRPDLYLPERAYCSDEILADRVDRTRDTLWTGDMGLPEVFPPKSSRRKVAAGGFFASLGIFLVPTMPEIEPMYSGVEEVLTHFSRAVKRQGSKMLVVVFPTRIQTYESQWIGITQLYALDSDRFDLTLPNRRIAAVLAREEVDCLDLLSEFRLQGEVGKQVLFRPNGDSHYNELGQSVVAERVVRSVLSLIP